MSATLERAAAESRIDLRRWIVHWRGVRGGGVALYVVAVGLVGLAYYLAGRVGLELADRDGAVAARWPHGGRGLAVLFLFGIRLWPGGVIGDLLLRDFST